MNKNKQKIAKKSALGKLAIATIITASAIPFASVQAEEATNTVKQEWVKSWGEYRSEAFMDTIKSSDGGYVVVGRSESTSTTEFKHNGFTDAIIAKYDKDGNKQWIKNFGGKLIDYFFSITETSDGGYIAVGRSDSANAGFTHKGNSDAIIVKYDKDGNQQWVKSFGGTALDSFESITKTSDGGCLAVGFSFSSNVGFTNKGYSDAIIVKYDKDGNQQWVKNFGGKYTEGLKSIIETSDGGYVAVGELGDYNSKQYPTNFNTNGMIIKLDANGSQEWLTINKNNYYNETLNSVVETPDGGYVTVGMFNSDGVIIKYDKNGNQEWTKNYGGTGFDRFRSIIKTSDNGYLITGSSSSKIPDFKPFGDEDAILIKYDSNFNKQFVKNFGGNKGEEFYAVNETDDGGYFAVGGSLSANAGFINKGSADGILVKFSDSSLNIKPSDITAPVLSLSPNTTSYTNQDVAIQVSSSDEQGGSGIKSITLPSGNVIQDDTASYTISENGDYIFTVEDNAGNVTTQSLTISNIDKIAPEAPSFTATPSTIDLQPGTDIGLGVKEVQYSINGSEFSPYTNTLSLPDGEYTVSAKAIDYAGNESELVTEHATLYGQQLQVVEDSLAQAQTEVTQSTIDTAVQEVTKLPDNAVEKQTLSEEVVDIQEQVTNYEVQAFVTEPTTENYKGALESVASLQVITTSLSVSTQTVEEAEILVTDMVNDIQSAENNLIIDNSDANSKAIGDAIKFIQKAEQQTNKGLIQVAQKKINALEDGAIKANLQKRLNTLK